jgi:uncharacterized protein
MADLTLIFSLASLGFFGGFSHCVGMCGPFVLTQVGNRLKETPLEKFSELQRLKNLALLPYHLGRISTYSLIGFLCSFFTKSLQEFIGFKIFSALFLFVAVIVFLNLLLNSNLKFSDKIQLRFKSIFLKKLTSFFSKKISFLFQNPRGSKGYLLGVILGFIPCGLLYSAFLISGSFSNPAFAALGMIFFGIGTFPSLFLTSWGGNVLTKLPEFRFISKVVILLNIVTLSLMIAKLINN